MNILIRCEGDAQHGMGHVVRSLVLAQQLIGNIQFVMHLDTPGGKLVQDAGFNVLETNLALLASCLPADLVIVDLEHGAPIVEIEPVRQNTNAKIVSINGTGYKPDNLAADLCDLVVIQGIPHWPFPEGWLAGPEYIILRPEFVEYRKSYSPQATRVLISGGGARTLPAAVSALSEFHNVPTDVLIGPAADWDKTLEAFGMLAPNIRLHLAHDNVVKIMARSTMAIVAYGMTALELACLGIPMILLGLTDDHLESAQLLENKGCALALGLIENVTPSMIKMATMALLASEPLRRSMSQAGQALIDGRGVYRVVDAIQGLMQND